MMVEGFERAEAEYLEDDRDEDKVVGHCQHCGQDLHVGDDVILIDGEYICDDYDCLLGYTGGTRTEVESE